MRKKYTRIGILFAAGLFSAMAFPAFAAPGGPGEAGRWRQDEKGWWLLNWNGTYPADEWQKVNGKWYYFDSDGYMMEDCWLEKDGKYYRLGQDGAMFSSGETEIDGIVYRFDESGQVVEGEPSQMPEEEREARSFAGRIVSQITDDTMTKPEKAAAIYNWVQGNMTYTTTGPKSGEAESALYGFRRHSGCCYEYYAMSHYLLEAAGMPNIPVVRASDGDHFWNLVDVDGIWYHFDATPRRLGGRWCLVTTGELRKSWISHNYDVEAYPKTP